MSVNELFGIKPKKEEPKKAIAKEEPKKVENSEKREIVQNNDFAKKDDRKQLNSTNKNFDKNTTSQNKNFNNNRNFRDNSRNNDARNRILLKNQINFLIDLILEIIQEISLVLYLLKKWKKKLEEIILQRLLISKKLLEIMMIIRRLNLKKEWMKILIKES